MNYKLVVDSSCDISPEVMERTGAVRIPLVMRMDNMSYIDDSNLNIKGFIDDMIKFKNPLRSSCPSPSQYADHYTGEDPIFVITLSSRLSGSYSSAVAGIEIAQDMGHKGDVHVFDSKSASAGEVVIAHMIDDLAKSGATKQEIIDKVEHHIKKMETLFILEDVMNLVKNGRMSRVTGTFVSALHIRPLLSSDGDGNIILLDKARGTQNAIKRLVDVIGERCPDTSGRTFVIAHCFNPEMANYLKLLVEKRHNFKEVVIVPMGGLSSMYASKGGLVTAF